MDNPVTVDFETLPIDGNPLVIPPLPIGVAVWVPGEDPWYRELDPERKPGEKPQSFDPELLAILEHIWYDGPTLFHNAPFDLSVARAWLGLEFPTWQNIHDTMYLLFLNNPYGNLSLKPAAEELLELEAEEQDELNEWIRKNVPGVRKRGEGAHIWQAPIDLVAKYAEGDVVRTRMLFDCLWEKVCAESVQS